MYKQKEQISKQVGQINSMHQGEKLRKHLKSKDYSQKTLLEMTTFSKSKLYGLYKQSEFSKDDKEQLIRDFGLNAFFFDREDREQLEADTANTSEVYWQKKHSDLLEKYYDLLEKYNACLEDKEKMREDYKSKVKLPDKHVSKS